MTGTERINDQLSPDAFGRPVDDLDSCIDDVAPDLGTEFTDDRELLGRVRAGEDAAFAELFSRHAGVARGFALRYAADVAEAEDIAAEAFFRVLQAVRRGSGPEDNVRGYLLTVIRRLAAEWHTRRRDVPVADAELSSHVDPDGDQAGTRAEATLITRAFTSLPQRWRRVLWQVEVEGERPAVVAPHFGLSPNATAALARRAREGLRAAYLQAHVTSGPAPTACQGVIDKLGAYTAGLVRGSEAQRIVAHLAGCASCRSVQAELADVCAGLRRYAGALPIPIIAPAALHHPAVASTASLASRSATVAGKSALVAGKVAVFGARLKLALVAASVVVAGGVGITAGPLLLHIVGTVHADRGTVQQLPVLPVAPTAGSAGSSVHNPSHSTAQHLTATRQPNGPTPKDSHTSGSAGNNANSPPTGSGAPVAGQPPANQPAGQVGTSTHSTNSVQDATTTNKPAGMSPNLRPHQNPTLTPTMTSDAQPNGSQSNPVVWSTEYTTDGTTVWITRWIWYSQGTEQGAPPPGR